MTKKRYFFAIFWLKFVTFSSKTEKSIFFLRLLVRNFKMLNFIKKTRFFAKFWWFFSIDFPKKFAIFGASTKVWAKIRFLPLKWRKKSDKMRLFSQKVRKKCPFLAFLGPFWTLKNSRLARDFFAKSLKFRKKHEIFLIFLLFFTTF